MRRKTYLLCILCFCLMLLATACTSKEERIAALKNEADTLVDSEEYEEAISKYNEILKIKSDDTFKLELELIEDKQEKKQKKLEEETDSIQKLKDYRNTLLTIQREKLAKPKEQIHYIDLYYILNDIKPMYDSLNAMSFQYTTGMDEYVRELQKIQSVMSPTMKSAFSKDFAKSSERARNQDTSMPFIGGEIGSILNDIDAIDNAMKSLVINNISEYVEKMINVPTPDSLVS